MKLLDYQLRHHPHCSSPNYSHYLLPWILLILLQWSQGCLHLYYQHSVTAVTSAVTLVTTSTYISGMVTIPSLTLGK